MANMTVYQSTGADELFVKKEAGAIAPKKGERESLVTVDDSVCHQVMDGFGASFTDSAAYLINRVLDGNDRDALMVKLFDHEGGIGISALRNPMGSSDYARKMYNYDSVPEGDSDFDLSAFTIARDLEDILPLSRQALEINPRLKIMASPWSPPGWMKTTGSMLGGELRKDCYGAYAEYFVRFIQEYAKRGLDIYAVTPQNEPLYVPANYPGMLMPPADQSNFIVDHLKPTFKKHGISTKILCYDHNWDRPDYPLHVLDAAGDCVDGVAWHWYGGKPVAQNQVHMAYPDKEVHFTEGSGGEWIPEFEPAFSNLMRTVIEILRNHAKTLILWNMALDERNGPSVPGFGTSTCRGIARVNQGTGKFSLTLDYYGLAHFSKFIRPGAVRVDSSNDGDVRSVAFKNADSSEVVVLFNDADLGANVGLSGCGTPARFYLPPKSALTVVYGMDS